MLVEADFKESINIFPKEKYLKHQLNEHKNTP